MASVSNAFHVVEADYIAFRRTWRGRLVSSFLTPLLYLAGMGFALGTMVDRGAGDATLPLPFLTFVATGLLAATAMQHGFGEGAWPVMTGVKWQKTFHSVVATPLTVTDLINGKLWWGAIQLALTVGVFAVVAVAFGAIDAAGAAAAFLPSVMGGVAFQAAATALSARLDNDTGLTATMRFGIVPMFLFSGTFFPVSQLPDFLEPVAIATPLFHAVELVRKLALPGSVPPVVSTIPLWAHLLYLGAMIILGWSLAVRFLSRRLRT